MLRSPAEFPAHRCNLADALVEAPPGPDEALHAADQRMYEGKRSGRGHVLVSRWPAD